MIFDNWYKIIKLLPKGQRFPVLIIFLLTTLINAIASCVIIIYMTK